MRKETEWVELGSLLMLGGQGESPDEGCSLNF